MNITHSKSKVIRKLPVVLFSKISLGDDVEFSIKSAYNMVYPIHENKKFIKKSKKSVLKIYKNHLKLSKLSWFTDENVKNIAIEQIKRFFIFKLMLNFLILGIESRYQRRSYVLLKIDTLENLLLICEAIENHETIHQAKPDNQEMMENRNKEIMTYALVAEKESNHIPKPTVREKRLYGPATKIKQVYEPVLENRHYENNNLSNIVGKNSTQWQEDIKFITYNPKDGNIVDNQGSVYMYTAHQVVPDYLYNFNSASSSSNEDLNSLVY